MFQLYIFCSSPKLISVIYSLLSDRPYFCYSVLYFIFNINTINVNLQMDILHLINYINCGGHHDSDPQGLSGGLPG